MITKVMSCVKCGDEFNPKGDDKKFSGGKFNECAYCSIEIEQKYTGVMVYDHKTAATIQINAGTPDGKALTEYLLKSGNQQRQISPPSTYGAVIKVSVPSQSRRGDTETKIPQYEPSLFNTNNTAGTKTPTPQNVQAVWYDPSDRKMYRIADGKMYEADIGVIVWNPIKSSVVNKLSRQKGLLMTLLDKITEFMVK